MSLSPVLQQDLLAVLGVLVDTQLDVLVELLIKDLVVLLVLGQLGEHLERPLEHVLLDQPQDLVLLQRLDGEGLDGQVVGDDGVARRVREQQKRCPRDHDGPDRKPIEAVREVHAVARSYDDEGGQRDVEDPEIR